MENSLKKINLIAPILFLILIQTSFALEFELNGNSEIQEQNTLEIDILVSNHSGNTTFSKDISKGSIIKTNNSHAKFEWTPNFGDAGISKQTYEFTFTVESGNETEEISKIITVIKKNNAFSIISINGGGSTGLESNSIEVVTDRANTTCKYDTSEKSFSDMAYTMINVNNYSHNGTIKFTSSGSYTVHIMCQDELKNNLDSHKTINFQVTLKPKAEIYLSPDSPVRAGLTKIKLITTEPLMEAPSLTYSLTKSDAKESVTLVGDQTSWEGYMVIEASSIERVGTFEFKGLSVNNLEGTEILKNKIFIVDSEAPKAPTSIKATSQNNRIKIEWYYPQELEDQIQEYRLYRKDDSGGTDYVDYYTTTNKKHYYDEDVELNNAYYYKVSAVKTSGVEGDLSKEAPITFRPEVEVTIEELEPILRIQLESMEKQVERYVLDLNRNLEDIKDKTGAEEDYVEKLNLGSEITNTILDMNKLNSELLELEGQTLSESQFKSKTQNILDRAEALFNKAPQDLEVIDHSNTREGYDNKRTATIFSKYLEAQQINLSENEVQDYIQETASLQQSATVNAEKTLVRVRYEDENKDIMFVNKKIDTQGLVGNITLIENIPQILTSNLNSINSKIQPLVMKKKSLLVWEFEDIKNLEDTTISYYVETNAGISDVQEIKTIISKNKIEEIKQTILSGMVTRVENGKKSSSLLVPTILVTLVLIALIGYYFWMDEKTEDKVRNLFKNMKKKKMQIIPEKEVKKHKTFDFDTNQDEIKEISKDKLEGNENITDHTNLIKENFSTENKDLDKKEEEKKMEFDNVRNMLKEYKDNLSAHESIPAHKISELYEVVSDIKGLCDDIHNDKIYNYAIQTKKELEDTIQKIETQKNTTKEKILQKESQKAPEGQEFITHEGKCISSVKELKEALDEMPEYIFYYHVNKDKNDFADWIENVFSYKDIAEKIKNIKNKEEFTKAIN